MLIRIARRFGVLSKIFDMDHWTVTSIRAQLPDETL
jgi:hypothetical protein